MSNSIDFPPELPTQSASSGLWGKLYGVGVGPGDPELITVKGLRILERSPLIALPAGRNGQPGIAQQIIAPWLRPEQTLLPLDFPYIQDDQALQRAWDRAARRVLPLLVEGQDVCFVSEGDVSFYSTFSYLAHSVAQLAPQEEAAPAGTPEIITIPGICSPLAAAATLGHPLTLRQQKLLVLPALYDLATRPSAKADVRQNEGVADGQNLERAIQLADVIVLMKIGSEYPKIWSILKSHNLLERSYIVERATWPEQQIHRNLEERPQLTLNYFSLWIIPVTDPPPPLGNFMVPSDVLG